MCRIDNTTRFPSCPLLPVGDVELVHGLLDVPRAYTISYVALVQLVVDTRVYTGCLKIQLKQIACKFSKGSIL